MNQRKGKGNDNDTLRYDNDNGAALGWVERDIQLRGTIGEQKRDETMFGEVKAAVEKK